MAAALAIRAQDCVTYFPLAVGSVFEIQTFNKKNKLIAFARHTVMHDSLVKHTVQVLVRKEMWDERRQVYLGYNSYMAYCHDGTLLYDTRFLLTEKDKNVMNRDPTTITFDILDVPSSFVNGQKLQEGALKLKIGTVRVKTEMLNRQADGMETITIPAGTFECIKISYDAYYHYGISKVKKLRVQEWYSAGVGLVASKTFNSKGELQKYSQLSSIKKPLIIKN